MKRSGLFILTILWAMALLVFPNRVFAYTFADYAQCTQDAPIAEALSYLDHSSDKAAVEYIMTHGVKIMFKNMVLIGPAYRNHDALSWITDDNHQIIYINQKHYGAPPQAIAAVISHEVLHNDRFNSIAEEVAGWTREEATWQEMLMSYPVLRLIKNGQFPLVDRENAIYILETRHQLKDEIRNNSAYKGLPEHSPGF